LRLTLMCEGLPAHEHAQSFGSAKDLLFIFDA